MTVGYLSLDYLDVVFRDTPYGQIPVIRDPKCENCDPNSTCVDCPIFEERLDSYDLDRPKTLWERLTMNEPYDYGERQPRADMLIKQFRAHADGPPYQEPHTGKLYTPSMIATEIEQGTLFGRSFVAVAGVLLAAVRNDPTALKS